MKILITGTTGLALALADCYRDNNTVTTVSRTTGHHICDVQLWGTKFLDYDLVFNNAYDNFFQVDVLEFFHKHWKDDPTKTIVSIGSMIISNTDLTGYKSYKVHKLALQTAHNNIPFHCRCDIKIINPGAIDTPMLQENTESPKFTTQELAEVIKTITSIKSITRVDLNKKLYEI